MEDDGDTGGRFYVEIHKANNMTFESACEAGVVLIFSKYQGDYSEKNVLSFLNMMSAVIFKKQLSLNPQNTTLEILAERIQRFRRRITA